MPMYVVSHAFSVQRYEIKRKTPNKIQFFHRTSSLSSVMTYLLNGVQCSWFVPAIGTKIKESFSRNKDSLFSEKYSFSLVL